MAKQDKPKKTKKEEEEEVEEDKTEEVPADGESKKKRRKRKRKRKKNEEEDNDVEEEVEEAPPVDDDTPRTLFVEGVPYDSTEEQVAECLQKYAKIERSDMTDLRFPTWQDTGRMRGYGHVVFANKELLEKALKTANNTKLWMGKRYLSLQRAKPKGTGMFQNNQRQLSNPSKTIMIKNLDYDATEDDILRVMEKYGTVVEGGVRIARNFANRQSKGFAYIEYEDLESAKKAMERQQKSPNKPLYILKRACLLDYDEGRIKGSFKTASGRLWSKEYKESNKQARTS